MKFLGLVAVLGVMVGANFAQAELVSCKGQKITNLKVTLDFDPTIAIPTIWKKGADGRDFIQGIKNGKRNGGRFTTARVEMKIPRSEFKAPYSGTFPFEQYYEVNIEEKAGSGYSYKFNGEGYTSFHGHDEGQLWDAMVYIAKPSVRAKEKTFTGLLTIQPSIADQGYYHVDLVCTSKP